MTKYKTKEYYPKVGDVVLIGNIKYVLVDIDSEAVGGGGNERYPTMATMYHFVKLNDNDTGKKFIKINSNYVKDLTRDGNCTPNKVWLFENVQTEEELRRKEIEEENKKIRKEIQKLEKEREAMLRKLEENE